MNSVRPWCIPKVTVQLRHLFVLDGCWCMEGCLCVVLPASVQNCMSEFDWHSGHHINFKYKMHSFVNFLFHWDKLFIVNKSCWGRLLGSQHKTLLHCVSSLSNFLCLCLCSEPSLFFVIGIFVLVLFRLCSFIYSIICSHSNFHSFQPKWLKYNQIVSLLLFPLCLFSLYFSSLFLPPFFLSCVCLHYSGPYLHSGPLPAG